MQWLMLQQESPEDFAIASGKQHSVRDFVNAVAAELSWVPKISFEEMVAEMVREDLKSAKRDELTKRCGYTALDHNE